MRSYRRIGYISISQSRNHLNKNPSLASPDIRPDSPKSSSDEQTYVLPQLEEWPFELELVDDDRQDKSCHDLRFEWLRKMFVTCIVIWDPQARGCP